MKLKYIFLFILILSLGISLRIFNIGKYDFWCDETVSILLAKETGHLSVTDYNYFIDPPIFYLLLSFWLHLGKSEFILRFFPFIFGVLSIPAIYLVSKELFNKKVGLISAFILAVSPFHIYYSQELRTYSLVTFLALMTVYYLVKALKVNKVPYWVGFIIFTILTIYSHNIALLLIIAVNTYFILFYKRYRVHLRRWLMSQSVIFFFYLPWVGILFKQLHHIKASNLFQWMPNDYIFNLIRTFLIFDLGVNSGKIPHFLANLLVFPLLLLGIWNNKEKIYLLLSWLFVPIIMSMIVSKLITSVFLFRTLIYVSPAYYILISYGLSKLKPNKIYLYFLLFFSILVGLSLKNYYQNAFPLPASPFRMGVYPKKEIRLASSYIDQNYQAGDIVAHTCEDTYFPFLYYHNKILEEKLIVSNYREVLFRTVYSKILKRLKLNIANPEEIKKNGYDRIWLILSCQKPKDIKEYFDRNYVMAEYKEFKGITIYLYQIN